MSVKLVDKHSPFSQALRIPCQLRANAYRAVNVDLIDSCCAVREYPMSQNIPAVVAEYETNVIPKAVLQQKLHARILKLQAPDLTEGDKP